MEMEIVVFINDFQLKKLFVTNKPTIRNKNVTNNISLASPLIYASLKV